MAKKSWGTQHDLMTMMMIIVNKLSLVLCHDKSQLPTKRERRRYVSTVKLATLVEGDLKALFLIATTPRCRGRALLHSLDCSSLPLIHTL